MPEIYDRVDAVVRLATTNPFSASNRGMSQGEYCYTNELPEEETGPKDKAEREPKQPGITALPTFNPYAEDTASARDSGRRQRPGYGRDDPGPAQSSRRRRDSPASPTP
ncbi:hypothetical protein FRC07_006927, partial [Ceratobasidium sp. 392]